MPDEQSLDFGAELAQAREQRGITLAELSRRTKIGVDALKAIERGDMTALPGGLYTRGFLRAYAREVGCNPDDIVRRYREKFTDQDVAAHAVVQFDSGVSLTCAPGQVHVKDIDAMTRRRSWAAWTSGAAVVLIGTAIHFAWAPSTSWKVHRDAAVHTAPKADVSSAAAPSSQVSSVAAQAAATGTSGAAGDVGPQRPTDTPPRTLHLDVKPSGDCWLSATADGQRVLYRLMTAGEHTQIEVKDDVVLVVGDPSTCAFDINGTSVRRLGAPGQPVTVHLTRDNFEQYLDRPASDRHD